MADGGDAWTTIESDPGVFTELINDWGVTGVQVEELFSLDSASSAELKPVYGLIFLFKWQQEEDQRPCVPDAEYHGKVFFAKQVITNACATQALLAILLNRHDIHLGKELTDLRDFTADFPPDLRGHAISNSESIRKAHNSFRPPNPIISEEKMDATKEDDVYHYIAYLPIHGELFELDGLKPGPIHLCSCTEDDWLESVQPFIQQRIEKYSENEIRFNLLALIRDRRLLYREELQQLQRKRESAQAETSSSVEDTICQLDAQIQETQERLHREEQHFQKWHDDNIRRRHNFIPFVFNLLRIMAEEGRLHSLIEKGRVATENSPETAQ